MSHAKVYSTAQFGCSDDVTATGLYAGSVTFSNTSEQATAPDHIGCDVGMAVYNGKIDVSIDGIISAKGTGLVGAVGLTVTLANTTNSTRTRLAEFQDGTAASGAAIIITGGEMSSQATGFETGSISGVYCPFVAAGSPTTLT
jgi:hypothetical protein